ncbi:MAG TPA: hypothetical protein VMQ86_25535 [Bryobacteraceae bacterium]|jgi:hypothetical protein|nr:hypothetical protein [Bryobacteraceae bacterium]
METIITTAATPITAGGPLAGVSTATLTGNFTLKLQVTSISSGDETIPAARISIEDSATGAGWLPLLVACVTGPLLTYTTDGGWDPDAPTWTLPGAPLQAGNAGNQVRVNVKYLGGAAPSLTLNAQIDS